MVEKAIPLLGIAVALFFLKGRHSRVLGLAFVGFIIPSVTIDSPIGAAINHLSPRLSGLVSDCSVLVAGILVAEFWMRGPKQKRLLPRSIAGLLCSAAVPILCTCFVLVPPGSRPSSFAEEASRSGTMMTYSIVFVLAVCTLGATLAAKNRGRNIGTGPYARVLSASIRVGGLALIIYGTGRALKALTDGIDHSFTKAVSAVALASLVLASIAVIATHAVYVRSRVFRIRTALGPRFTGEAGIVSRLHGAARLLLFPRSYMVDQLLRLSDHLATTTPRNKPSQRLDHFDVVGAVVQLLDLSESERADRL